MSRNYPARYFYFCRFISRYILYAFMLIGGACASNAKEGKVHVLEEDLKVSSEIEEIEVNTINSQKKIFYYYIQGSGKIIPRAESKLQFKQDGFLKKIQVQNGQVVKANQIIAELEKINYEIELQKAENKLAAKKAEYQDMLINHRIDFKEEEEIDSQVRENFRVKSGLAETELEKKEAEIKLKNCTLHSPISGIVSNLKFKPYNQIKTSDELCVIYSNHHLELIAKVLESEVNLLKIGQTATIQLISSSSSNQKYSGVLSEINPHVDENGLVEIKIRVSQAQGLLAGMNAVVKIAVPQKAVLVVPKSSIVVRAGRKVIFTEEDGQAKWNYVETGLENETEIEIIDGLEVDKKVIIDNNLQLDHNSPVKVIK